MLIIDSRMREIEKQKLIELGYELFEIKPNNNLYYEISSHVDIHCAKIKDVLISTLKIPNSIQGSAILHSKYPYDISYNVCSIGNYVIHNFKYTDSKICEIIEKYKLTKINIKQGYSKCSIAVIDDNSVIVTDSKISVILKDNGFDVLHIPKSIEKNIHLFKNSKLEYSDMNGFIGGVISRIDNYVFISGDLNKIDSNNEIKTFIEKRNLQIIDFSGYDIIDYGGIIKF